tara:strand:+ start:1915 stop:2376 length:462 start_codon:yes stop_codon:yes gene_type:complete
MKVYTAKELVPVLKVEYRKILELVKTDKIKTLEGVDGKTLISEHALDDYLRGYLPKSFSSMSDYETSWFVNYNSPKTQQIAEKTLFIDKFLKDSLRKDKSKIMLGFDNLQECLYDLTSYKNIDHDRVTLLHGVFMRLEDNVLATILDAKDGGQ